MIFENHLGRLDGFVRERTVIMRGYGFACDCMVPMPMAPRVLAGWLFTNKTLIRGMLRLWRR